MCDKVSDGSKDGTLVGVCEWLSDGDAEGFVEG